LSWLSVNGHEGVVRVLLANGAQQGLLGKAGRRVLHFAAASGRAGVVRLLCDAPGAPLDTRDGKGCTPLFIASRNGCEGAVCELLARGARLDVSDRAGLTALHRAAEFGHDAVIALLCAAAPGGSQVDARGKFGHSPLMLASKNGREGAVRALLACGARLEPHDSVGWTALHLASDGGHAGVVELLCAAPGARADARDDNGNTPLIIASISGRGGAVRALLACGARQELQGQHGETALHWAAKGGHAGVVELLCAAPGAALALALRDSEGNTPLACALTPVGPYSVATTDGRAACAAALRAHGAS
jgi:ankyrin repeat protein